MSEYLGFNPSENPFYYFLSYNSEDKEAVGRIAMTMMYSGIHLWYDYGIDYGEKWEEEIAHKIKDSQGVILFFTRGILAKEDSYVQKEYKIAKFLNCKVYVVFLDQISPNEVPVDKVSWWIDLTDKQNLNFYENEDISKIVERLSIVLGIQTHEDKMNKIISSYTKFYFEGRLKEADLLLQEYLSKISLQGKVELFSHFIYGAFSPTQLFSNAIPIHRNNQSTMDIALRTHTGREITGFYEGATLDVNGDRFIIGNDWVFHRGSMGDAHVIWIWRNGELIHTIGGLVEANNLKVYWDSIGKIIFISYLSDYVPLVHGKLMQGGYDNQEGLLSITTVENPNGIPVCTDFKFLDIKIDNA